MSKSTDKSSEKGRLEACPELVEGSKPRSQNEEKPHIGTLNEKPLHASLKQWIAEPTDQFEVPLEGFFIDVVRDNLLIEIQTGGFSPLKKKLRKLTKKHPVRLVYPIPAEKWLVQPPKEDGGKPSRRKSPKRGNVYHVFKELVAFPDLMQSPNFALQVLLTQEEEHRKPRTDKPRRRYRKKYLLEERQLIDVVGSHLFKTVEEVCELLPADLPHQFTTKEIAEGTGQPAWLVQKMAYCLRNMEGIQIVGKRGRYQLYERLA